MSYKQFFNDTSAQRQHSDAIVTAIRKRYNSDKTLTLLNLLSAAKAIQNDAEIDEEMKKRFTTVVEQPEKGFDTREGRIKNLVRESKKQGLTQEQTAYVLATAQAESSMRYWARLWETKEKSLKNFGIYYGRGYSQISFDFNYKKFEKDIPGITADPDLALKPNNATYIIVTAMKNGMFTGRKLSEFINDKKQDYYNARQIVAGNGKFDKAHIIANSAKDFLDTVKKLWKEV
jgi:hypothetical protein